MSNLDELSNEMSESISSNTPVSNDTGVWDDSPLDEEYDPELQYFKETTGFDSYEAFYAYEKEREQEIDKIRETISINSWEKLAIAIGIDTIAYKKYYNHEHSAPYEGEPTPIEYRGAKSLADKIGLHLINPFMFVDKENYLGYIKKKGYEFDEYGLVWYTDEEKANIGKEKEIEIEHQEQPEQLLTNEQLSAMKEIFGEGE